MITFNKIGCSTLIIMGMLVMIIGMIYAVNFQRDVVNNDKNKSSVCYDNHKCYDNYNNRHVMEGDISFNVLNIIIGIFVIIGVCVVIYGGIALINVWS